jgi:alkylation response protein AidB-like acyl-CoA dehydrogenase
MGFGGKATSSILFDAKWPRLQQSGFILRDAKLYEIGAGTSKIRRMLIGRELFEKSA